MEDKEQDITGFHIPSLEMVTTLLTPSKPFVKLIDGLSTLISFLFVDLLVKCAVG